MYKAVGCADIQGKKSILRAQPSARSVTAISTTTRRPVWLRSDSASERETGNKVGGVGPKNQATWHLVLFCTSLPILLRPSRPSPVDDLAIIPIL